MVLADQQGNDLAVTLQPYYTFPATPLLVPNAIGSFGWFRSGFALADNTTTCSFGSVFPVSGKLNLRGGTIFLSTDLIMHDDFIFASGGRIKGNNHTFEIATTVTGIPSSHPVVFENTKLKLNGDLIITSTITVRGSCAIEGKKNRLIFGTNGNLRIDHGASLKFHNIELQGIENYNIRCVNDTGSLILDGVRWVQTGNYSFTQGSILAQNTNVLVGPYTFAYASQLTSTIASDSSLYIEDFAEIQMGRLSQSTTRQPLYFTDLSSVLGFEQSTLHITGGGMQILHGTILGNREFTVEMDSTSTGNGFIWGNGIAVDDMQMKMLPGSTFIMKSGHLTYNTVNANNFFNANTEANFIRYANTTFHSKQNINYVNVNITVLEAPTYFITTTLQRYTYKNATFNYPLVSYTITGTRGLTGITDVLDGNNNSVFVHSGTYPFGLSVDKPKNSLSGSGAFGGPVNFTTNAAELGVDFEGKFFSNINPNGGRIILKNDMRLSNNVIIANQGKVALNSHSLLFGPLDLNYTGSISWTANRGRLLFDGNVNLSSEWSFTGNSILDMNDNNLILLPTGKILIGSNSTLRIKRAHVSGIAANNIRCIDHSGKLILDDVIFDLSNHYTFSQGSIEFKNNVDVVGSMTFLYTSVQTSTIDANSTLKIADQSAIRLGRSGPNGREAIYFEDSSSVFAVDNGTIIITPSGARFTRGTGVVDKQLIVEVSSTSTADGIIFGDGTPAGDFIYQINPGALLYLPNGHLGYQDTTPYGIQSVTTLSRVVTSPFSQLVLSDEVILRDLTIDFTNGLSVLSSFDLRYENCTFIAPGIEFTLTGLRLNAFTNLLNSGDSIIIKTGALPTLTQINGVGASISGFGSIGQTVIIPGGTSLNIAIDSLALANITLLGGTLNVLKNLTFADNKEIVGTGIVDLNSNMVELGGLNLYGTGTLDWVGDNGAVGIRSNLYLTSRWTFSGACTIDGGGNTLIFGPTGRLVVADHTTVVLKDIKLDGLLDTQFICLGDSSKIIFDSATLSQDATITFSLGSFEVINDLTLQGRDVMFAYQSTQQSKIRPRAILNIKDDFTFSYEPASSNRTLLSLVDDTTRIIMTNSTIHSTETGLQLTKGYLEVHGQCYLDSGASCQEEGIVIGDSTTESNNLKVDIHSDSNLQLLSGYLTYRNVG